MNKSSYFRKTSLFNEYIILNIIGKQDDVTQREISRASGLAVSTINGYISMFEKKGYLSTRHYSHKQVKYVVTKKGYERKNALYFGYLKDTQKLYNSAKRNISAHLKEIANQGVLNIILYGAGEFAEILIQTILEDRETEIKVLAVVDDDEKKQNHLIHGLEIVSFDSIFLIEHDAMLISVYHDRDIIIAKLEEAKYDKSRILSLL